MSRSDHFRAAPTVCHYFSSGKGVVAPELVSAVLCRVVTRPCSMGILYLADEAEAGTPESLSLALTAGWFYPPEPPASCRASCLAHLMLPAPTYNTTYSSSTFHAISRTHRLSASRAEPSVACLDQVDNQIVSDHRTQAASGDCAEAPPAMDFAALMSKEIAKAKPKTSEDSSSSSSNKYMRRADAEVARQKAYLAEQKELEEKRAAKAAEKRKREDEAAEEVRIRDEKRQKIEEDTRRRREEAAREEERKRRKRLGLPELKNEDSAEASGDGEGEDDIPDEELLAKLRALGEPATLFGESHRTRLRRYRKLTTVVTKGPIPTTLQLVDEKDMKLDGAMPKDKESRKYVFRQLASYFTMVLREWESALAKEERRDTFESRAAVNAMVQSRENMVPLFRKLEKGDLDDDILEPVIEIVKAAQERRYVDANDGYLRLSIGKAAWPIGVTMVGIHERSAREKLHNGERGHVMGDEVTRKYLQSIKRCLTFAQVRWPPEDVRQLMG